ncbi:MAG: DUF1015 domain-containing protein [Chitinophagaceae bacterium]|nr:DUF1015 domain-containing protein [Chitinophagaceae bacterium]
MVSISPFKALRPNPQYAREVASRPYDVLNVKEAKEETIGKPYSFLHVTRSEIDLPAGTDVHTPAVYEKAKENLDAFIGRGILFQENKPCYYIYELEMGGRTQAGLVCCSSVADYENGLIKKHEFTRPDKEQDRVDHIHTTHAQTGNVFLAYRDVADLNDIIDSWKNTKTAVYDITAEDGIRHTVWIINDDKVIDRITELFKEEVPCTYIADGHHRAASAARVKYLLPDFEEAGHFLCTLFPASQLKIMDYNRVVKDLNGMQPEELLQKLEKDFTVAPVDEALKPEKAHQFGMYLKGRWYKLESREGTFATDPVNILDVSILQQNVLAPFFNIHDQRTDSRIDFVGGIRGMKALEQRVDEGDAAVAFSIYPVSIQQLFDIADSGNVMPPKSTWFEPKLRDGLLVHLVNE